MPKRSYRLLALSRVQKIAREHYEDTEDERGRILPCFFVRDILTDLRHYCDRYGVEFGAADRAAHGVYLEEMAE